MQQRTEILTVADFPAGSLHRVSRVASLFSVAPLTVRRWISLGFLKSVSVSGRRSILIPGESIRERYREMGLDPDVVPEPLPVSPAELKRRADKALKELHKRFG